MMTSQELRTSPLFENISYEDYRRMLTCFQAVQRSFLPEEMIYDFAGSRADAIGIVERGSASLIRIDEEGVATVLEEMGPGGVFGRNLAFAGSMGDSLEVVAGAPAIFCLSTIRICCADARNACTYHSVLVQNMLGLLSDKAQALSERVDVLSRRSIRDQAAVLFSPAG